MRKIICFFLLAFILTSCKTEKVSLKEGSRTFYYQQPELMNSKTQTFVTLTEVQDARCPEDVVCIWAGYVTVYLEFDLRDLKKKQNTQLCFNCMSSKPGNTSAESEIDLEGTKYRLTLQSVKPNPNIKTPPKKEDYEVSVLIEKL